MVWWGDDVRDRGGEAHVGIEGDVIVVLSNVGFGDWGFFHAAHFRILLGEGERAVQRGIAQSAAPSRCGPRLESGMRGSQVGI